MKGYSVNCGYMGLINGEWMLFATENDYYDYYRANSREIKAI